MAHHHHIESWKCIDTVLRPIDNKRIMHKLNIDVRSLLNGANSHGSIESQSNYINNVWIGKLW